MSDFSFVCRTEVQKLCSAATPSFSSPNDARIGMGSARKERRATVQCGECTSLGLSLALQPPGLNQHTNGSTFLETPSLASVPIPADLRLAPAPAWRQIPLSDPVRYKRITGPWRRTGIGIHTAVDLRRLRPSNDDAKRSSLNRRGCERPVMACTGGLASALTHFDGFISQTYGTNCFL
ncbi:hypothetical protein BDV95DRAFT_308171 [Massariosphaeria phaeospora]|uniref:Uncharacterized protein n=1 Tax=Massariosphaeria phaeospora TaxID=100035 RepID=A0A7C8IAZ5_9PLEO|nr:hypothetical protein BDV95DRAFT_308171 [Massariosphaeria phaeospora]